MTRSAKRIVVIGGGISGLASAALLARDGHHVTLLEQRAELGGRAGSWAHAGFRFDTGPSWYLMPEVFDHFYELMGTSAAEQLVLDSLDPGYRTYFEGQPKPFDLPAGEAHARAALIDLDPSRAGDIADYLDSASETYRVAIDKFLYGSFDSPRPFLNRELLAKLPKLARLLTRSLDGEIRSHTNDSRLRRLLGYPAVFLGGTPMQTPAMYHLMSHVDVADGVYYPQGGFARVVESIADLARGAGVEIATGVDVERIVSDRTPDPDRGLREARGGRVRGVIARDADGTRLRIAADIVVATGDLRHVERDLLGPGRSDHTDRWWERRTAGPGAVLAMLGVRGDLPELAHHTLFLTADWDGGFRRLQGDQLPANPSVYVGKPSASDPAVAPAGHENLFVLIPVPADPGLGRGRVANTGNGGATGNGKPERGPYRGAVSGGNSPVSAVADDRLEDYVDRVIEQIGRWAGIPDLPARVVVRRTVGPGDFAVDLRAWRGSALGPAHTLRQSAFLRAGNKSRRVDGLYFAGSSTIPGIGVPMCLISAELVAKRVRGDASARPMRPAGGEAVPGQQSRGAQEAP